jgi:hypothetical protein
MFRLCLLRFPEQNFAVDFLIAIKSKLFFATLEKDIAKTILLLNSNIDTNFVIPCICIGSSDRTESFRQEWWSATQGVRFIDSHKNC